MSTHADPDKAYVWLDGDGWRAPAGTAVPTDPFAQTGLAVGGVQYLPYGGIEAGFEINTTRDFKELPVWNRRLSAYKTVKGPKSKRAKMRCVDNSAATVLTVLQGGAIVEVSPGIYRHDEGDDEEFAILLQLRDGDDYKSYHSPRVTLVNDPAVSAGGEVIDGYDFELIALEPFVPYTSFNPLVVNSLVTLTGSPSGGTFTLTWDSIGAAAQTTAGIAYNAAASAVKSALEALSSVGAGNADVTGSAGGPYTVSINGVGVLTGSGASLTPSGGVTVAAA